MDKKWYDNAKLITFIIIGVSIFTIIMSQVFAVKNNIGAINTFRSLLNHNTIYIIGLIYFILINTSFKKYFNTINIIYIFIYLFIVIGSILTVFQSFGLVTLITLIINFLLLIYMIYAFLFNTRLWKEFRIFIIPMDEVNNEWYFYSICMLSIFLLLVNLVGAVNFDGIVLSIFDMIYTCFFARYIYLYKNYEINKNSEVSIDAR